MPKVSVIVPVYNVEKYLDKCLLSLVNQTLKDIEIIVVNDGSPDNSQDIIDRFKKDYPKKIVSLIKENGGLSDARNYGIEHAKADYIGFVDGDDFVDVSMFEKMYNKAIEKDFDLVVCNLNYVYDYDVVPTSGNVKEDTEDIKKTMLDIYPTAWNKLYKKDILNKHKLRFKKGVWFEDVEFIYRVLPYVKTIGVVKECFYEYVQREGAISKTYDERLYHYIDNFNGIVDYYKKNELYDKYYNELEYAYVRYIYGTFIKQAMNYPRKKFVKALKDAKKNVKRHFPKYRKNKYFYKNLKGLYMVLFNKPMLLLYYLVKGGKHEK